MKPNRFPTTVFARVASVFVAASVRLSLGPAMSSIRDLPAGSGMTVPSL